jgi:hypothetical protein
MRSSMYHTQVPHMGGAQRMFGVLRCPGVLHQGCKPSQCQRDIPQLQHLLCSGPVWHHTQACLRQVSTPGKLSCWRPLRRLVCQHLQYSIVQYSTVTCCLRTARRAQFCLPCACTSSCALRPVRPPVQCSPVHDIGWRHSRTTADTMGLK